MISVLMPMRNAQRDVKAAIESVLGQRDVALELIVIDDGSTDRSRQIAQAIASPRLRVIDGPCQGVAAALNAGLAAARGDFVARCDADDLYVEGRLAQQQRWLQEHPQFGAICGGFATMTRQGRPIAHLDSGSTVEEITAELRRGVTRTSLCTYLVRIELLRRIGGFRPWFATAEDMDAQLRLGEVGRVWFQPHNTYFYRLHDASLTHSQSSTVRQFYEATARACQLQRQQHGHDDLQLGQPPALPNPATRPLPVHQQMQEMLVSRSWREHRAGQKAQAILTGLRACLARPWTPGAWKSLLALAAKRPGAREARCG